MVKVFEIIIEFTELTIETLKIMFGIIFEFLNNIWVFIVGIFDFIEIILGALVR